jgi:hypothetical protein
MKELQRDPADQFVRRALVRNVCSTIEVRLFEMSSALLSIPESIPIILKLAPAQDREEIEQSFDINLSAAETLALKEEAPVVDQTGIVKTRPTFLQASARFRLITSLFTRVLQLEPTIDYGTKGWEAVKATVGVRNRLVHPKSEAGTSVTDEEMIIAMEALGWAAENLNDLIERAELQFEKPNRVIGEVLSSLQAEHEKAVKKIEEAKNRIAFLIQELKDAGHSSVPHST